MKEAREIVKAWRALEREGREAVLATVLRTRGSTYRKAGARMLMTEGDWVAGAISGGCLEGDLLRKAWWRTAGRPVMVTYDGALSRSEEDEDEDEEAVRWGFGLGCDGSIDVLLERLSPSMGNGPLDVLEAAVVEKKRGVISTSMDGSLRRVSLVEGGEPASELAPEIAQSIAQAARAALEGGPISTRHGGLEVIHELVLPPMPLVIFGSNYDALPLAELASNLGWDVTLVEKRPSAATRARFAIVDRVTVGRAPEVVSKVAIDARTAVVVMTHSYEEDRAILPPLLASPARYIGLLGPRRRTERLLGEVSATERDRARVHGPIGLDLGGRSPEEIALSIVAEIQSVANQRSSRSLRESLALAGAA